MFNYYQQESTNIFKPVKPLQPQQVRVLDWCLGLGGEAGEVLDLLKHAIFHEDTELDKMELAKELGDVLWYVSAIATTCGIDLADIAELNKAKLKHRYNGVYSVEASANRHEKEKDLKNTPIYRCLASRICNDHSAPLNVIFIGPDGSGKTTITTKLAELTGMKRIKCDYRQEDKPRTAINMLNNDVDVIYDRFYFPDELIYSAVKDMPLEDSYRASLYDIWDTLKLVNPVFVYVDADIDELIDRSKNWADDYVVVEQLTRIKAEYESFLSAMEARKVPIIKIDTTGLEIGTYGYDGTIQILLEQLNSISVKYGTSNISAEGGLKL